MRAPLYAVLLLAWALLPGCLSAPRPEDWLAVGFRTPEATFRTFQTGLRGDKPELEYRCLGSDFKRRTGVTLFGYLEYRQELFRKQPWLKLAAKAKVREVKALGEGRVRLVAEVDTWFHDETFALDFVREDYYELYVDGKIVSDDQAAWREIAREKDGKLVVSVPLPDGLTVRGVGELRAGSEWKVDGFPLLEGAEGTD
jgi:hypothetical protein